MNSASSGWKRRLQAYDAEIEKLTELEERMSWEPPAEKPRTFEDARAAAEGRLSFLSSIEDAHADPDLQPLIEQSDLEIMEERLRSAIGTDDQTFSQTLGEAEAWATQRANEIREGGYGVE